MRKFIPIFIVLFIPVANAADPGCRDINTKDDCMQLTSCTWTGEKCDIKCNNSNCTSLSYCYWNGTCKQYTIDCTSRSSNTDCTKNPYCYWMDDMPDGSKCQSCANGQMRSIYGNFCITTFAPDDYQTLCDGSDGNVPPPLYANSVTWAPNSCSWSATCPLGTHYVVEMNETTRKYTSKCAVCPDREYNDGIDESTNSILSYSQNSETQSCKTCQEYFKPSDDKTQCEARIGDCHFDQYYDGDTCLTCPADTFQPEGLWGVECLSCTDRNAHAPTEVTENDSDYHTYCVCNEKFVNFDYDEGTDPKQITTEDHECSNITGGLPNSFIQKIQNDTQYNNILDNCTKGGYYWNGDDVFRETDLDLCNQECEPGYYCEPITKIPDWFQPEGNRKTCPIHFTSEAGATSITKCYMKTDTQFCDNGNNCQTIEQIFGADAKIYYTGD